MIKSIMRRSALLMPLVALSGCSNLFGPEGYFRDRGDDYLKADVIAPMQVPAGVEQQKVEQLYAIPAIVERDQELAGSFEVPRPQPLSDSAFTDRVKIQKLSGRRWILVSAPPAEVWPQVRGFLSRNNLNVVFTDATSGVIETGWLKFKGDEETKDKYRLQIEQGVQPDSTEIHVLHMSVDKDLPSKGQINWPARSINGERESWMLDELAATIASDSGSSQAASLLAQTIGLSDKVKLDAEGEEPVLRLVLEYNRAWATVGHAVRQGAFSTWGSDEVVGVYYIDYDPEYTDETEEPGFFSRWFGSADEDQPESSSPYSLSEVLAHLQLEDTESNRKIFKSIKSGSADPLDEVPGYLVVVRGWNDSIEVRVRDGYARNLPNQEAKKLLNMIRHNLI